MADQLQFRRSTSAQILVTTGAQGEIFVNTDTHALVVQDGITAGGFPQATGKQVNEGTFYYNEDTGSAANAYLLVPKANTNAPSSYLDGIQFGFVSIHPNIAGPCTANFFGLGVKSLKYAGGTDPLAGDIFGRVYLIYDATNGWMEIQRKSVAPPPQIRTIGASVGSSALTATLAPCLVDFRASSLGSGTITNQSVTSQISLTVPAGATLGTTSAIQSRLIVLAILGPSAVELAIVNLAGGVNLDETTLVNTTAITSGSNANNVIYSTTARTGVPFRVMGYIESTQATAGTWATVPSTVQGQGGQALSALSSLGYAQTWQALVGSRAFGTTYTNTTGKPICISVSGTNTAANTLQAQVNGVVMVLSNSAGIGERCSLAMIVPPGATYSADYSGGTKTLSFWNELR